MRETFRIPSEAVAFFSVDGVTKRRKQLGLNDLVEVAGRDYTSLQNIRNTFNEETALEIIRLYLIRTQELLDVNGMDPDKMMDTAQTIIDEYPRLKITELHEFFRRLKAGYYAELYGSIDVRKIMISLKQFIEDRNHAKAEFNRRKEKQEQLIRDRIRDQKIKSGEYISREEWLRKMTPEQRLDRNLCPEGMCSGRLIVDGDKKRCDRCSWKNFKD